MATAKETLEKTLATVMDRARFRARCYFCRAAWGKCSCVWNDGHNEGFLWQHTGITEPNVSECARFYVNPVRYYGASYVEWMQQRGRNPYRLETKTP